MSNVDLTDEEIQKVADKVNSKMKVLMATEKFKKEFKQRSFSGRNPELGKMIKCVQCGLRHRDNVKHGPIKYADKPGTPEGESNPMEAQTKRYRPVGNKYWRARPGMMMWIPGLNKFVNLTR
jgi:hypothetical protein